MRGAEGACSLASSRTRSEALRLFCKKSVNIICTVLRTLIYYIRVRELKHDVRRTRAVVAGEALIGSSARSQDRKTGIFFNKCVLIILYCAPTVNDNSSSVLHVKSACRCFATVRSACAEEASARFVSGAPRPPAAPGAGPPPHAMRFTLWGAAQQQLPLTGGRPPEAGAGLACVRVAAAALLLLAAALLGYSLLDEGDGIAAVKEKILLLKRNQTEVAEGVGVAKAREVQIFGAPLPGVKGKGDTEGKGGKDEDGEGVGDVWMPVASAFSPPMGMLSERPLGVLRKANRGLEGLQGTSAPAQPYLSACVMAKDAADALPEFVARNHLAGVDHFVIMDDSEVEGFEYLHKVLEPVQGLVTLVRVSRDDTEYAKSRGWSAASQISSLLDCAESLKGYSTWVAFIDVDEFFEASEGFWDMTYRLDVRPTAPFMHKFLNEIEARDEDPAVCVRWKTVMTNGRVEPAPCGVLLSEYYPSACNVTGKDGHPLARRKAIVRVDLLDTASTPRDDSYGHTGYNFLPPFESWHCAQHPPPEEVAIMHYWSMSLVDYLRKIARGRPRRSLEQRTMFDLLWREQMCEHPVLDLSSAARQEAVRAEVQRLGYRCAPVPAVDRQWSPDDEQRLNMFVERDAPAMQFMMRQLRAGRHFDDRLYADAFRLKYKSVFGGFLAAIDLIPWVHYYLHGYDPATADRWFNAM